MSDSAADPARGSGLGSFLGLLNLAAPVDAIEALRALGGPAIADGIARAAWPLPVVVTDFVLGDQGDRTPETALDGRSLGAPQLDRTPAVALARRLAARNRVASQEDDALRRALLRLADPDVDEVLFALGAESVPWWVRVAILRSRRGPDGRAIVPAKLKQQLLDRAVAIAKRRGPGAVRPGINEVRFPFPSLLVHADDSDLVRAALMLIDWNPFQTGGEPWERDDPRAQWWVRLRSSVAAGVETPGDTVEPLSDDHAEAARRLRDYVVEGWRNLEYGPYARTADSPDWDQVGSGSTRFSMAWDLALDRARRSGGARCVGLDEAAFRDDCPPDVRARLTELYPRAVFSVARPDVADLLRANAVLMSSASPLRREKTLRTMAIRGLACGSLDPAEAVAHIEPAAVVVSLAVPNARRRAGPDATGSDVRGRIAVQSALVAQANRSLGSDPVLWCALIAHVATWPGSFGDLLRHAAEKDADLPLPDHRAPRWPHGIDAAAVVLALAPEGVAEHFVAIGHPGIVTRILDRGPLNRVLVAHAVGPDGTRAMRLALARNPATPIEALWHLVYRDDADPGILGAAYLHPAADTHLRTQIILRSEAKPVYAAAAIDQPSATQPAYATATVDQPSATQPADATATVDPRLTKRLARETSVEMLAPLLASRDPLLVYSALHKINAAISAPLRALAYATLAEQAGPEVVWALDAERTGSALTASSAVRASMASGTAEPLVAAVDLTALPEFSPQKVPLPPIRGEDFPDAAITWPDAKVLGEKLHGSPDRWRALAAWVADEPDTPVRDLLDRVVAATGDPP